MANLPAMASGYEGFGQVPVGRMRSVRPKHEGENVSKQIECSEEMYQAFKAVAFAPAADAESMADAFKNALQVVIDMALHQAKPIVEPILRGTHVGTAWTYPGARGGMTFKTKELAIADALAHGYREGKQ